MSIMDSFFDNIDDELLQIFSIASSPVPAVPLFQPPSFPPTPNQTSTPIPNAVNNRKRKARATKNPDENENENENRKIMHRNVERQRRQEMSNLYSSLRSLLPQEYLKGKRSVSDHMHEAVNYIKYLQTKTRALNDKRDALKRLSKFSKIKTLGQSSTNQQDMVTVRLSSTGGAHIVVDASIADNCFPLSKLIRVLEDDEIYLISSISTVVNNRSMYKMECEVNWKSDRDLNEVQNKLSNLLLLALN